MTSTPTIDALVRGVRAFEEQHHRHWTGPIYLTEQQAGQILRESGQEKPDDWDEQVAAEFVGCTVLGSSVRLAVTVEESTPYLGGWLRP